MPPIDEMTADPALAESAVLSSVERPSIFARQWRVTTLGVVLLVTLLAFEAMAVGAALPTAARDLSGLSAYGWAFTGFLVANVVGIVVSGQVNDRHGPRLPLAAGLVLFLAGLVISGSAVTMFQLICGRVVQGLGGGLIITSIYVVIGTVYSDLVRPKVFAAMSSAWVLPSLLGPALSGTLAEHASWRWVFLGLVPFVLIGALLLAPVLPRLPGATDPGSRLADPHRIWRALATAFGVAALAEAGQHPSIATVFLAIAGIGLLAWGLRTLLPAGTFRARPGVPSAVALRGLLAGAFFGAESMVPLSMSVQHGYAPIEASLPLTVSGVAWALGSWWQGREAAPNRIRLIRAGFAWVAFAAAAAAVVAWPAVPGWVMYIVWAFAGLGAGLTMSSVGVILLESTTDADRGADSAALQVSDVVSSSLTTGLAGVLVALAVRGTLGYSSAFTVLNLAMAGVAIVGASLAGRARPVRR